MTAARRARRRGGRLRLDGAGARARLGPAAPALPGRAAAAAARRRRRHRRRRAATRRVGVRLRATRYADWRELLARDDVDVVSVCGPNFVHREIGGRGRRVREAPLDREAGRPQRRGHRRRSPPPSQRRGCSRRSASTTATRRRSSWPASWSPSGRLGDGRDASTCACSPTTPRTPTARCRGASTPSTPAPACSATWPATASTWRRTSAGERPAAISELVADQATFITERPVRHRRGVALRAAAATGRAGRSATRTRSSALLRFESGRPGLPRVLAGRGRRAVHATASRSAGTHGALSLGLPPDGRAAGLPRPGLPGRGLADPARRARATASSRRSSRARAWRWATTTSRSSRPRAWSRVDRHRRAARAPRSRTRSSPPAWSTRWCCRTSEKRWVSL